MGNIQFRNINDIINIISAYREEDKFAVCYAGEIVFFVFLVISYFCENPLKLITGLD